MPQQPMSQSDALGSPERKTALGSEPGGEANFVAFPFPDSTLPISNQLPPVSPDLLNDIVERARSAANAGGAAIALRCGDDIVCLAETGSGAPSVGVRLNLDSGLSGACAQSRTFQRCDDTETDARVDPDLCRRLGIRSILVFPILRRDALLGIVEVFSPDPHAFGDREVQALASVSRTIGYILDSSETPAAPPGSEEISPEAALDASVPAPETVTHDEPLASAAGEAELPLTVPRRQDHLTTVLTLVVIVLAISLGWLLGRGGLRRANLLRNSPARATASLPQQVTPVPAPEVAASPGAAQEKPPSAPLPKHEAAAPSSPHPGELLITQNGKVIYRQPGSQPLSGTNAPPPASLSSQAGVSNAVLISPETANQYLAQRVEPEYPEQAREQHLQGPVTLEAVVGKDGSVKSLKTISGDPQLAAAARNAVRQWRFKPFLQDGKPAEFQTQVTVNFRLP